MKHSYIKPQVDHNIGIRNLLITVYIFLSFYEHYIVMMVGSVTKYYIFLVIVLLLMTSEKMHVRSYQYAVVGWLFYKFLSLMWTPSYEVFGNHAISEVGFVILLVSITALHECDETFRVIKNSLWVCSAVMGVLSLFFSSPYQGHSDRLSLMLFGVQNDPNNVAAFLLFGVAIATHSFLYEKKHKLINVAVIAINAYATILTGSRAGFLSVIIILLVSFFCTFDLESFKKNYGRTIILFVFIVLAGLFMYAMLPTDISSRLFEFSSYEGGSNRDIIWAHGLKVLSNPIHLLIGAGWGGYKADGGYGSLHNTFLSILCDTGLFGFLLLFVPVGSAIYKMLKKRNPLPFTVFIAGMAPSFFIEAINKRFFWNTILFVFVAYNCYLKEQNSTQETSPLIDQTHENKTNQLITKKRGKYNG